MSGRARPDGLCKQASPRHLPLHAEIELTANTGSWLDYTSVLVTVSTAPPSCSSAHDVDVLYTNAYGAEYPCVLEAGKNRVSA